MNRRACTYEILISVHYILIVTTKTKNNVNVFRKEPFIMSNILMYIYFIICGGLGAASCIYMTVSAFVVIGQKIYGRVAHGKSLYD